jgi:hypothetical protein
LEPAVDFYPSAFGLAGLFKPFLKAPPMAAKTEIEIDAEVAALRALRPNIRPYSAFGDDNRAALDACVLVLVQRLNPAQAMARFCQEERRWRFDENLMEEAVATADWLVGQQDLPCNPSSPDWWGGLAHCVALTPADTPAQVAT